MNKPEPPPLVRSLREFGEMPQEGGPRDPLIEVMNGLAHAAADEIERLLAALAFVQRSQGLGEAVVMATLAVRMARPGPVAAALADVPRGRDTGMSYDISLCDPVTDAPLILNAPHHMRGGTYQAGGSPEASLNVTYNYGEHFRAVLGDRGIRRLYGMTGAMSLPVLREAAGRLADNVDPDYWAATEGNAKRALLQLAALAEMRPDGVWHGD